MTQNSKERNPGIEVLRIVSMFAIVVLHVLGYGGVLGAAKGGATGALAWLLETICLCGVTVFGLISGYVG